MQVLEDFLKDPTIYFIVAEDEHGLFHLFRFGKDQRDQRIEELQKNPEIKWWRDFHNQRPQDSCRGAREAATDFFRELQQRNLNLPPSMSYLRKEI